MPKTERFKQNGPKDQVTVVLMGLEGHLDNWNDGVIDNQTFSTRVEEFLQDCRDLGEFLPDEWLVDDC